MTTTVESYRNALLWAFDRLNNGLTLKEQRATMREIGNVLSGRASPAATYQPTDWDESAGLPIARVVGTGSKT